jgi:hypothetical protein
VLDQIGELGKRLLGGGAQVLLELRPLALPLVTVKAGLELHGGIMNDRDPNVRRDIVPSQYSPGP